MIIKRIYKYLILLNLLFLYSCYISDNDIKNQKAWKVRELCGLHDFLSFEEGSIYKLKNDTILRNNTAVAIITKREYRWYADDILHIRNIENGKIGSYIGK